jgi:hypothetical protein
VRLAGRLGGRRLLSRAWAVLPPRAGLGRRGRRFLDGALPHPLLELTLCAADVASDVGDLLRPKRTATAMMPTTIHSGPMVPAHLSRSGSS